MHFTFFLISVKNSKVHKEFAYRKSHFQSGWTAGEAGALTVVFEKSANLNYTDKNWKYVRTKPNQKNSKQILFMTAKKLHRYFGRFPRELYRKNKYKTFISQYYKTIIRETKSNKIISSKIIYIINIAEAYYTHIIYFYGMTWIRIQSICIWSQLCLCIKIFFPWSNVKSKKNAYWSLLST